MRGFSGVDFDAADQPVTFPNADGLTLTGRLFVPPGNGPFAAAVILHGCQGMLKDSVAGDSVRRLDDTLAFWGAALRTDGLAVLIVDSYTARRLESGCGTTDTLLQDSIVNADTLINEAADRVADAFGALNYLRDQPYVDDQRVAVVGFASGGGAAMSAMALNNRPVPLPAAGGFRTAAAYYPDCKLRNVYGAAASGTWLPYGPVRVLHGSLDTLQSGCADRLARAAAIGADSASRNPVELTRFAGAKHDFDRSLEGDTAWTAEDLAARDQARLAVRNILRAM